MRWQRFTARADAPDDSAGASGSGVSALKLIAYVTAIALLAASVWFALRGQTEEDWRTLLAADPWLLAALLVAVLLSTVVLPGLQFWLATVPFVTTRRLGITTMVGLSAGSQLLNYTPVKAGLIGRIGYLRLFHGVGYRAALVSHALLLAVFVAACALTLALTLWRPQLDAFWLSGCAVGLLAAAALLLPLWRAALPADLPVRGLLAGAWPAAFAYLLLCLALQVLVQLCVALRWWLVFRILGQPVDLATAWVLAILHMVVELVGPANGLGLREWLVGAAGNLQLATISLSFELGQGLSAALLDRAAEAAVVILVGVVSLVLLRRAAVAMASE